MRIRNFTLCIAAVAAISTAAAANEFTSNINSVARPEVKQWIKDPVVVNAIKAQNRKHAGLSQADVDRLDKQWRSETGSSNQPMINKALSSSLSNFLKRKKAASQGLYTEIFVMDNKGLNVGQSDVTSDYWQGDEAKWKKTYLVGADATHIGKVKKDESTQMFQSQLSLPIVDPANNQVIGAITVGVNVEMLAQTR
jgi:opacity protein-like surface antigen